MNKFITIGRLTKEPELKTTNSGKNVCQFSIAVNRDYTSANGEKETDFFNVVTWGKTAETVANYVKKGQRLLVEGRVQNRSYEKDGEKKYITEVFAERVEFIEKKGSENTVELV